jgi:aryl-alcohol dehydrogenase-like predicted oxidoreductase
MELRPLGRSGLLVSRLALGTMTWGRDTDRHEARDQLLAFVEAGGTLVDTADVYADGQSEEIVGSLVDEVGRDAVLIATKAVSRAESVSSSGVIGSQACSCHRST